MCVVGEGGAGTIFVAAKRSPVPSRLIAELRSRRRPVRLFSSDTCFCGEPSRVCVVIFIGRSFCCHCHTSAFMRSEKDDGNENSNTVTIHAGIAEDVTL